jgi:hypothetical protein
MHIGVDLDDTALDSINSLISFHNKIHGTNFKKRDFHSCWYREVWGGTKEDEVKELEVFSQSDYYNQIAPMPGSQLALHLLAEDGHKLSAITGRVYSLTEKTEKCIEKHFSNIFSGIYHTNSYGLTGAKIKKSEICKQFNVDVIIDDDLNHIIDCTSSDLPVIVYDSPWNQGALPEGSIRMKNWIKILELIRALCS